MGEPAEHLEVAQPMELFDEAMLPVRNDLEEMVRARSFVSGAKPTKHTGKIVIRQMLNDEELCEAICTALLAGLAARLVGKRFGLSPKSVANIRDAMADRGELAPVRTRIQRKLDRVTELGLERIEEGLTTGEIPAGSVWIPTLATLDKREQMSAGMVVGTERTRASVTVEQVLAEHALAKQLAGASASQAGALAAQLAEAQAADQLHALPATGPATGSVTLDLPTEPVATTPAAVPGAPAAAPDGGGGVASAPPAHDARGVSPRNFTP